MEIKQIIVDELPENCTYCLLLEIIEGCRHDSYCCMAIEKNNWIDYSETRPTWCPLVVEKVCEWKFIKCKDEDYKFRIIRNCLPEFKLWVNKLQRDPFCPNCGRKIRYEEE